MTPRPFISYAREDFATASKLYEDLRGLGFDPWMDTKDLLGGHNWAVEIARAIRESSHFIAILSATSVTKRGVVQKELSQAISILEEIPPGDIFVIPVRIDDVQPRHEKLENIHWIDLFPSYAAGLQAITRSLEKKPPEATSAPHTASTSITRLGRSRKPQLGGITGLVLALAVLFALIFNFKSHNEQRWVDQNNCGPAEHWVGMSSGATERAFQVTAEEAKHAVFHGELRWSPVINQLRQTTVGEVLLNVDGRENLIYKWNSPSTATDTFDVRVSHLLVGTSGRFTVRWRWVNGTSGICVARSSLFFPPG